MPGYVKARQKDWLSLNMQCDSTKILTCLKQNYEDRLKQLHLPRGSMVFAANNAFSYENGDVAIEIAPSGEDYRVSIWGGFKIHNQASRDNGRATYVGCEFDGKLIKRKTPAIDLNGTQIDLSLINNELTFTEDPTEKICAGFGGLPDGAGPYRVIGVIE